MIRWLTTYCAMQDRDEADLADRTNAPELAPTRWAQVVVDLARVVAYRDDLTAGERTTTVFYEGGGWLCLRLPFPDFDAAHAPWRGV